MLNTGLLKKIFLFATIICSLLIIGCKSEHIYNQTESNVADVTEHIDDARSRSNHYGKPIPSMVVKQGPYVDKTPISIARDPAWLKNHIILRGEDLPFSYYSRTIVNGGGNYILTRYQVGLDPSTKISMNYSGSVRGALDLLASKTGYMYSINGCNVYWQAFITRTFDVAFMPGSSDYLMGKSTGGGSLATAGGSGSNTVSAVLDDSAQQQYSSLKGSISVWKDIENSIRQMLSPDGKVMVSESTTSVTVRDRPQNVSLVGHFISNLNHTLSKQVLVKIQVLEISLSSAYNYGINWSVVQRFFGGGSNFILNSQQGVPVSITALGQNIIPPLSQAGFKPSNPSASTGYNVLLNALTQQGKVSTVTEPRVVCLNNQVSAIRILNSQGYLASVQNTTVGGTLAGSSSVTSQLTPGTLITGLTLYILPKVIGDKIIMQVNADLSVSNGITPISSQTGTATAPVGGGAPGSFIQVPSVTQKQFNQRGIIYSGDTLILSGFRQVQNTANATQFLDIQALGGRGAIQNNIETIILITPVILRGSI